MYIVEKAFFIRNFFRDVDVGKHQVKAFVSFCQLWFKNSLGLKGS